MLPTRTTVNDWRVRWCSPSLLGAGTFQIWDPERAADLHSPHLGGIRHSLTAPGQRYVNARHETPLGGAIMHWYPFLQIRLVRVIVGVYSRFWGASIFKQSHQKCFGSSAGSPSSRLQSLLKKADACAASIIIVSAILCALSGIVVAVSGDAADALWLIVISGLLCWIASNSILEIDTSFDRIPR